MNRAAIFAPFGPLFRLLLAAFLLPCLGGCAFVRSDSDPLPQTGAEALAVSADLFPSGRGWPEKQWWRAWNNGQLNVLVETSLAGSPDLAVFEQRSQLAKAGADLAWSNQFPLIGAAGAIDRQRVSRQGFLSPYYYDMPLLGLTGPWYTSGTVGVTGSFELDIWGKNRAIARAALGQYRAALAEQAQAELIIASAVCQAYWDMQTLYALREILTRSREIEALSLRAEQARYSRGMQARTEAELARTRLAGLDEQLAVVEGGIVQVRESLRALTGLGQTLPEILPAPLPDPAGRMPRELGFELLARRPDLQAARHAVEASLDAVEAARAAFYPSFNLLAFVGFDALHLEDLFTPAARQINLIGGAALPLFDAGRLNAGLRVTRAESNLTIAVYNKAVVDAAADVARGAAALQSLERQSARQAEAVAGLEYAAKSAGAHLQRGLLDRVSAAQAELPLLVERGRALELRGKWIAAEIAMIRALGGGWRVQEEEAAPAPRAAAVHAGRDDGAR